MTNLTPRQLVAAEVLSHHVTVQMLDFLAKLKTDASVLDLPPTIAAYRVALKLAGAAAMVLDEVYMPRDLGAEFFEDFAAAFRKMGRGN